MLLLYFLSPFVDISSEPVDDPHHDVVAWLFKLKDFIEHVVRQVDAKDQVTRLEDRLLVVLVWVVQQLVESLKDLLLGGEGLGFPKVAEHDR